VASSTTSSGSWRGSTSRGTAGNLAVVWRKRRRVPTDPTEARFGPVAGLRVLDIGQLIAGPLTATLLADYGADVVKVERPGVGDPLRRLEPHKEDVPLWQRVNGRNKRNIALDLKDEADRRVFLDLVKEADVVVENFVPGTLEKMGVGYDVLSAVNPGIILLDISGYGQTGPHRSRTAFGRSAEAFSGLAYMTGYVDGPPMHSGFPMADSITGVFGALGVMAAVYERSLSGKGQRIDLALYEGPFRLLEFVAIAYDQIGRIAERRGTSNAYACPAGTWQTGDGKWATFTVSTQDMVDRFWEAIGHPELAKDPRYATNTDRVAHRDELDPLIVDFLQRHTLAEVSKIFDEHRVAIGPVYSIEDIFEDEHYRSRENLVEVEDPTLGTLRMQGIVPKFSRTPGAVRTAGGDIDAHRAEVLRDWLGRPAPEDGE
jgi:crotonobetainyl-CoA:carnitine CoA-transferase CaiB-like acyl-CoA transferase